MVTAYGMVYAALLAPAGRLADVSGRQRLFAWSVAVFTVASMLAAAAPHEGSLIFFRALQGGSAAGMSSAALGLILTWTPRERQCQRNGPRPSCTIGQARLVELARAIADVPRLLLDEPTSGLSAGEAAYIGLADTIAFMAADRSLLS